MIFHPSYLAAFFEIMPEIPAHKVKKGNLHFEVERRVRKSICPRFFFQVRMRRLTQHLTQVLNFQERRA